MDIYFSFADPISEAYRKKLQTILDTVITQGITENRPPYIDFPGLNEETYYEIVKLLRAYEERDEV